MTIFKLTYKSKSKKKQYLFCFRFYKHNITRRPKQLHLLNEIEMRLLNKLFQSLFELLK